MEALYRKYRPTTFSDVVGQEHIERTLKNAIEQNKVSHAYLFCGPRGTGKTTMARILAKALMCEKAPTIDPDGTCPECEAIAQGTHPDVYELDAASRTGVDNVREEIISRVNYAPTRGAWKIYIIDEAHMLTVPAFNALLKTLEEPPAHVMFILCTTDPQQVPGTIQSRCQRFDFHRISNEAIVSRLGAICVEEGVDFEGEALDLIAYRAEGGMRNALTALEQLIAFGNGHVTLEGAQNLLGSLDETDLSEIVLAIGKRDAAACFNWVARYVETGADLAQFVRDLAEYIRNMYLLSIAGIEVEIHVNEPVRKAMVDQLKFFGEDRLSRLLLVLGDLSKELRTSSNPRLSFEVALTRMIRPDSDLTIEALAERVEELERKLESGSVGISAQAPTIHSEPLATSSVSEETQASVSTTVQTVPAAPHAQTAPASPYAQTAPVSPDEQAALATPQAQVAPVAPQNQAPSAAIDLTNPAAVQRFWHAVTASLRKSNPARGVLFMNAKVAGEPSGNGLVVTFAKDNGFAYTAAQKPEVQQLLAQTIESVAGGFVPYRLVLEGGEASASMAPSIPLTHNQASAANTQANPAAPGNNSAAATQADRVRAAVQAAQAAARAAQARAEQPQPSESSSQPQPQPSPQVQQDATVMSAPQSQQVSPGAQSPQAQQSASVAQVQQAAPVAEVYDDDRVPLEAYGDVLYSEDEAYKDYSEVASAAPAPSVAPTVAEPSAASSASATPAPDVTSVTTPASPSTPAVSQESPDSSTPDASDDETARIKEILSNSFGEGIKFEELSD